MSFWQNLKNTYRTPSHREMLQRQLDEARLKRVEATKNREDWESEEQLQLVRIARIENELKESP